MKNPKDPTICGAHARTTGNPCQKPPMKNGRCRLHGGLSPGRPITTGQHTKAAKAQRAQFRELIRSVRDMLGGR